MVFLDQLVIFIPKQNVGKNEKKKTEYKVGNEWIETFYRDSPLNDNTYYFTDEKSKDGDDGQKQDFYQFSV